MKVITATMAKNIANDFMNNACGEFIRDAMDKILLEANKGNHSCHVLFPTSWNNPLKNNIEMFFCNLGYETQNNPSSLVLRW